MKKRWVWHSGRVRSHEYIGPAHTRWVWHPHGPAWSHLLWMWYHGVVGGMRWAWHRWVWWEVRWAEHILRGHGGGVTMNEDVRIGRRLMYWGRERRRRKEL